jgi:hypothetical protein
MEAISKKSGKVFTGKVAALMLRIGAATPADGNQVQPVKAPIKKPVIKAAKKKVTKK